MVSFQDFKALVWARADEAGSDAAAVTEWWVWLGMVAVALVMALPLGIRSGLWCDHDEPTVAGKLLTEA